MVQLLSLPYHKLIDVLILYIVAYHHLNYQIPCQKITCSLNLTVGLYVIQLAKNDGVGHHKLVQFHCKDAEWYLNG